MITKCANGNLVDHWYDRSRRESVTQVLDPVGNQIGDALYAGCRITAHTNRQAAIRQNGGLLVIKHKSSSK